MLAELHVPENPTEVVGRARWATSGVELMPLSDEYADVLWRIFRPTPVVVDEPALRPFGTAGPAVLQPGSVRWFQAAARSRAREEGLAVRFVAEVEGTMGWDPAGAYRTFADTLERRVRVASSAPSR